MDFDAVVLAGGEARRLGGRDKAMLVVGGRSLLDRALEAVRAAARVVAVGPSRPTVNQVLWTRESPAGGGPLAATAAGIELVSAEVVVVLAVDYPFVDADAIGALLHAVGDGDGAALSDDRGRSHYVVGAYRTAAVRSALGQYTARNASMHGLFEQLSVVSVPNDGAAFDVDDPDDLAAANRLAR